MRRKEGEVRGEGNLQSGRELGLKFNDDANKAFNPVKNNQ